MFQYLNRWLSPKTLQFIGEDKNWIMLWKVGFSKYRNTKRLYTLYPQEMKYEKKLHNLYGKF